MTITGISLAAKEVKKRRDAVRLAEDGLQKTVMSFLDQQRGSAREIARTMGISVQYVCDIRHGRRKVSDRVVEKLGRLK